jgi:predicted DNA-binding WGR domain protein
VTAFESVGQGDHFFRYADDSLVGPQVQALREEFEKSEGQLKQQIDQSRDKQESGLKDRLAKRRQQKEEEMKKKAVEVEEAERQRQVRGRSQ